MNYRTCEYTNDGKRCGKHMFRKVGDRHYCVEHFQEVQYNRQLALEGYFWKIAMKSTAVCVLLVIASTVSAQTISSTVTTLTVNGTNFVLGDTVNQNGTACPTTFVSATQLTAICPMTGTVTVTAPSNCITVPTNVWTAIPFVAQTGNFEIQFDATPSASAIDGIMGLSAGRATSDSGTSVPVLFSTAGTIQAMNGSFPYPGSTLKYTGGTKYHFTLDVNMSSRTYNAFVGSTQIAKNYAFRSAAGAASSLSFISSLQDVSSATISICNITIHPYPTQHSVSLTWTPGTSGTPATSFGVERAAAASGPFAQIATPVVASYTDTSVTASSPYCYQVVGMANGQTSTPSNMVCVTIPATAKKKSWIKRLFGT
jgi:hypothetical protein